MCFEGGGVLKSPLLFVRGFGPLSGVYFGHRWFLNSNQQLGAPQARRIANTAIHIGLTWGEDPQRSGPG